MALFVLEIVKIRILAGQGKLDKYFAPSQGISEKKYKQEQGEN